MASEIVYEAKFSFFVMKIGLPNKRIERKQIYCLRTLIKIAKGDVITEFEGALSNTAGQVYKRRWKSCTTLCSIYNYLFLHKCPHGASTAVLKIKSTDAFKK